MEQSAQNNKKKAIIDNRVSSEIIEFLQRQIKNFQHEIEHWSARYDADIEEYDTMLLVKQEKLEALQKDLIDFRIIFERRRDQIEDYLQIKARKEFLNKTAENALRLQAWWRATAFRKKLKTKTKRGKKKKKVKKQK